MATSGPGATNLVTGVTDAMLDSVPLVAISGQVPHSLIGRNAFQETDMFGMTLPVVKYSYLVTSFYDALNYLLSERDLLATFRGAYRSLAPGGWLIFDMNTLAGLGRWQSSTGATADLAWAWRFCSPRGA